jgi:hypothetical protein
MLVTSAAILVAILAEVLFDCRGSDAVCDNQRVTTQNQ